MNEIDAAGDLVLGATLAKAAEPAGGKLPGDGHTHEAACLNCSTPLAGDYCHACGQRGHVHRTIRAFFHDLVHGVLHFESKVWRTLPMLVWRPGELTRNYIEGQRARYVSPIALFLFSVFLMFAALSTFGELTPTINNQSRQDLASAEDRATRDLQALTRSRAEQAAARQPTDLLDAQIRERRQAIEVIQTLRGKGLTEGILTKETMTFQSSVPWIQQAYLKARQNPQLLIYKLKTNSYKWSWALIPLSVPFLWLMFPFSRRFRLYDHVVFVTYSLCFISLLIVLGSALDFAGAGAVAAAFLLIPPLHIFRQLSGAYSLRWWGALWRTIALLLAAIMVLGLFVLLIIAVGELG
ncbi:MAG: DUF3667 domain-containing protein [Sphingomicrobium sp.]